MLLWVAHQRRLHLVLSYNERGWVQLKLLLSSVLLVHFLFHNIWSMEASPFSCSSLDCSPAKQIKGIEVELEAKGGHQLDDREYGSIDHPPGIWFTSWFSIKTMGNISWRTGSCTEFISFAWSIKSVECSNAEYHCNYICKKQQNTTDSAIMIIKVPKSVKVNYSHYHMHY